MCVSGGNKVWTVDRAGWIGGRGRFESTSAQRGRRQGGMCGDVWGAGSSYLHEIQAMLGGMARLEERARVGCMDEMMSLWFSVWL